MKTILKNKWLLLTSTLVLGTGAVGAATIYATGNAPTVIETVQAMENQFDWDWEDDEDWDEGQVREQVLQEIKALNPKLNFEAATKAALKEVGSGTVTDIRLDRDNKQVIYEVRVETKDKEIELELHADSGKIIRKSEEPLEVDDKLKAQPEKSVADVEKALLKEYPSAKILDISLENTSKSVTYQAEILNGDTFQEILVDAKTLSLTEAPSDY
ncbi:PepSY domain-containing protein [Streptococcus sp. 121]|uniref:PepSY domain-containing protein n=1 Tax=Streptococcus sp. 121 TaxID=2797637 RepID=UPI0018F0ECE9|nr:PepSY domain-containing protein [Streptococcus sp. 121]MBJ6745594.1 PepSY domain-containing protein [Streptococcus sp. 121]